MRVAVHSSGVKSWGLWEGTFSAKSLNVRPQTDNWKEPHQQNDLLISSFASFSSLSSSIILRSIHADILTEWSFQKAKRKQQQHWKCCKDAQTDNSEIDLSQFYLVHIFSFFFFFIGPSKNNLSDSHQWFEQICSRYINKYKWWKTRTVHSN